MNAKKLACKKVKSLHASTLKIEIIHCFRIKGQLNNLDLSNQCNS